MKDQIIIPDIRMPEEPMSFELEELLYTLGHGAENAKSRKMLTQEMDISDRKLRKLIEEARKRGFLIVNVGNGYYLADADEEKERYYRQEYSRAMSILQNIAPLRHELRANGRNV